MQFIPNSQLYSNHNALGEKSKLFRLIPNVLENQSK